MTDSWMQNEDFCWGDESVVDRKCRKGPFHSVLCRLWLELVKGANAGYAILEKCAEMFESA